MLNPSSFHQDAAPTNGANNGGVAPQPPSAIKECMSMTNPTSRKTPPAVMNRKRSLLGALDLSGHSQRLLDCNSGHHGIFRTTSLQRPTNFIYPTNPGSKAMVAEAEKIATGPTTFTYAADQSWVDFCEDLPLEEMDDDDDDDGFY